MTEKDIVRLNISAWPELGINYWGINKNASSTLTLHFATLCGEIDPTEQDIEYGIAGKERMDQRYITQEQAFNNGLINFGVSRHPLTRFKSVYKHLKHPKTVIQQRTLRKARFDPSWTPEQFLEHIRSTFESGKKINKHWKQQTQFIPTPWRLDHVIKMERLVEDWPLDIPPPNIKSNPSADKTIEIDEALVYETYKDDYLSFGYPYQN